MRDKREGKMNRVEGEMDNRCKREIKKNMDMRG
jgi:hypothetical protein